MTAEMPLRCVMSNIAELDTGVAEFMADFFCIVK